MIDNNTTLGELQAVLAELGAPIHIRPRYTRAHSGGVFVVTIDYAGGNATLTNPALGAAIEGAIVLLRLQEPAMEPAVADPDGARVGPAPRPERTGTRIGQAFPAAHCASCGWGEEEGQEYHPMAMCPHCGASSSVCSLPNGHEGNHEPKGGEAL